VSMILRISLIVSCNLGIFKLLKDKVNIVKFIH
jgi:hypothetical protein